jgi:hypothetical protein
MRRGLPPGWGHVKANHRLLPSQSEHRCHRFPKKGWGVLHTFQGLEMDATVCFCAFIATSFEAYCRRGALGCIR